MKVFIECAKYANKKGYEVWIKENGKTVKHYEDVILVIFE